MKKYISAVLFMLAAFTSNAQISDTAFAAARYTFTYLSDTTMPVETENMILYLGKNTSEYKSYDRMISDSIIKQQMEQYKNTPIDASTTIRIGSPGMKRGNASVIYKETGSSKMQRLESFMKMYLIEEEMPAINWNMTQETKNIQDLNCQKATASFRGRNYTAWFASQLPYSNGPWKLGGLPGLIVEAYDDQQQVVFKFAGFENLANRNIPIAYPPNLVKATDKEYKQLREFADKDPQGFMKSRMAEMQGGMNVTPSSGATEVMAVGAPRSPGGGAAPVKRRVLNNPMERISN